MAPEIYQILEELIEVDGHKCSPYLATRILNVRDTPFAPLSMETCDDSTKSSRWSAQVIPPSEWQPATIEFWRDNYSISQGLADCMIGDIGVYFLSVRARDVLAPVVKSQVDWLPVVANGRQYYWMRVRPVLDAVNYDRSECEYDDYSSTFRPGRVLRYIHRYVFNERIIGDTSIFKILNPGGAGNVSVNELDIFVTRPFVDAYRAADLTGLEFVERWPNPEPRRLPRCNPYPYGVPAPAPGPAEPAIETEPLPLELREEMKRVSERNLRMPSHELVKELDVELDGKRGDESADAEALKDFANNLGFRFGYLLARELKWRLKWGRYGTGFDKLEGLAAVSPDDRYALFPSHLVYGKLTNKDDANTLLLLYNMLKAGQLPTPPTSGTKLIW